MSWILYNYIKFILLTHIYTQIYTDTQIHTPHTHTHIYTHTNTYILRDRDKILNLLTWLYCISYYTGEDGHPVIHYGLPSHPYRLLHRLCRGRELRSKQNPGLTNITKHFRNSFLKVLLEERHHWRSVAYLVWRITS